MSKIETITFHEPVMNITFTVMKEFEKICPDYKKLDTKYLVEKYNIFKYFHNETGPAVINHKEIPEIKHYFLNGQLVEDEKNYKEEYKEEIEKFDNESQNEKN